MSEPDKSIPDTPSERGALARYFARFDDGALIRAAFFGVLMGAAGVLGLDLREMADARGGILPALQPETLQHTLPVLPPAVVANPDLPQSSDPRRFVTAEEEELRQPISFRLEGGGVLRATGSIDPGSAKRLEAELEERGEYVKRVSLNSPGGALDDAIAMARLVRERGLSTMVEDGAICASSCPLLMSGGVSREAGEQAAIGLHQFYAATETAMEPAQVMADAQMTTARISRHLQDMGVDPAMWLHALDTPPRALYYLSAEEMKRYGLVAEAEKVARQ
jgi:hypothetical protein